jgi:hypothetical protein
LVLFQVLSALMAAAWCNKVETNLSSSRLVSLLFSSAQLAAAPAAAQLDAAADAAVLSALGNDADEDATAAAGASSQPKQKQQQQQLSAADIVRVLWSLMVLDALDIARLGWLLVALSAANWQKLEQQQLLVIKQAQVREQLRVWWKEPHWLLCWCCTGKRARSYNRGCLPGYWQRYICMPDCLTAASCSCCWTEVDMSWQPRSCHLSTLGWLQPTLDQQLPPACSASSACLHAALLLQLLLGQDAHDMATQGLPPVNHYTNTACLLPAGRPDCFPTAAATAGSGWARHGHRSAASPAAGKG